jgi:DNA-binding NarL/FixJ family response regulator
MEETMVERKVLILCEDRDSARYFGDLLREFATDEDGVAPIDESIESKTPPHSVMILSHGLGDAALLCIRSLRGLYPAARIVVLTSDVSLDAARHAYAIDVDEFVTSQCGRDGLRALFSEVFNEVSS